MLHINRTFVAYLDEMDQLTVLVPKSCCPDEMAPFTMVAPSGEEIPLSVQQLEDLGDMVKYVCRFASAFEFGATYWVRARSGERTDVQIGAVVRTPAFDDQFFYEGKLGVDYTKEQTVFRVWAPTATAVNVKLIHPDSGDARYVPLERGSAVYGRRSYPATGNERIIRMLPALTAYGARQWIHMRPLFPSMVSMA